MGIGSQDSGDLGSRGPREAGRRLTETLPSPADPAEEDDLLWRELDAQFDWYHRAATRSRLGYQGLKVVALIAAATATVLAALRAPAGLTAGFAAVVVVLEAVQQTFQFHANWITYRATAETLRRHAFLYAAGIAPYAEARSRRNQLAAVLGEITRSENTTWATTMRQPVPPRASL